MAKKYVVRSGFVVFLEMTKENGEKYERRYESGEELSLDDDQAAVHANRVEFASQKDRDAALAAEKEAMVAKAASQSPTDLVAALTEALSRAMAANAPAAPAA